MIGSHAGAALAVAAALVCAQASAAELVVVEARGLTLKPGQTVDDTQRLTLEQGDELTLVDETGSVIKLRGPYAGPPSARGGSGIEISDALAALGTGEAQNASGVVRAKVENETVTLPDPWVIDVTHSGRVCVRPGRSAMFWRQQSASQEDLKVMPVDRTWRAESLWPAGASELPAPAMFPMPDLQTYLFTIGGETAIVTLVQVPASLGTDRMRAAWMLQKNCLTQTRALVATMK